MTKWLGLISLLASTLAPGCAAPPEAAEITPVHVDWPGSGPDVYQIVNFYVAGQPSEKGLVEARARGVRTVVNLRAPDEKIDFDEKKAVETLGLAYVSIPVTPQTLSDAQLEEFVTTLKAARKQVLIHCASGNRASALWAAYLGVNYGLEADRAIRLAESSGLKSGDLKAFVKDYLGRRKGIKAEGENPQ